MLFDSNAYHKAVKVAHAGAKSPPANKRPRREDNPVTVGSSQALDRMSFPLSSLKISRYIFFYRRPWRQTQRFCELSRAYRSCRSFDCREAEA